MREPQRPDGLRLNLNLKTGSVAELDDLAAPDTTAAPNFAFHDFEPCPALHHFIRSFDPELTISPMSRPGIDRFALRGIQRFIAKTGHTVWIGSQQPVTKHRL